MPTNDAKHEGLRQRVEYWADRLHVAAPRVRIRDMTRKWGFLLNGRDDHARH